MKLSIILNGDRRQFDVPANTTLLALLRNHASCFSVKHGCETGECGACCVIMDGKIVNSCTYLAAQADEREIVTLEGLPWIQRMYLKDEAAEKSGMTAGKNISAESGTEERSAFQNPNAFSRPAEKSEYDALHPIQQAFVDAHAIQCGYCTPGMILSAAVLFAEKGLLELPSANPKRKVGRKARRKLKVPRVSEEEVRNALAGNLCRCTGYVKPVEAVLKAAEKMSS